LSDISFPWLYENVPVETAFSQLRKLKKLPFSASESRFEILKHNANETTDKLEQKTYVIISQISIRMSAKMTTKGFVLLHITINNAAMVIEF